MRSDLCAGIVLLLFSTFMYYTACQFPPGMFGTLGAGFFPKIIFGAMIALSIIFVLQSVITLVAQKGEAGAGTPFSLYRYSYVLTAFALFTAFVLILKYFGFVIASLVFMPLLMWIIGPKTKRSLVLIALVSIGMTTFIYFSFTHLLKVFLPSGTLF